MRAGVTNRMFLKGIVTTGRTTELAGMSEDEFLESLYRHGVRWRDPL